MTDPKRKLTPMMERYMEVKQQNPGTILLFRMGDFYELFNDDARLAAKVLGLTLTSRDKASTNPVPMAGFPYHALQTYLGKLIQAGYRAAICEQVEDPKQAKGLVKREVTQIVTPGTLTDEQLLDPRESNFLACLYPTKENVGLAWLEVSTGRFVSAELEPHHLRDELSRIAPAECIVPDGCDQRLLPQETLITERPAWTFARNECRRLLCEHFGTKTLDGFDLDADSAGVTAAGALLAYVQETQKSSLGHITRLEPFRRGANLIIDEATRRSLELTITLRDGRRDGSLLSVIDETVTPMGARLLAEWLSNPLCDITAINRRLDAVEELVGNPMLCREVREQLDETYDLQRLTSRIATGRASPRDLGCLAHSLSLLPKLKAKLAGREAALLIEVENKVDLCPEVRRDVESTLVDEPPVLTTDGGMIRSGCHPELDKQRDLARGGKEWIARYLGDEIKRTGIQNLKVGFNKVFGYYLEVTRAQADRVPDDYIRKQTLKNQERYITPELKEHEDKVLRAEERAVALEQELFAALRERVAAECRRLKQTAEALAEIDVLTALAVLAVSQHYCRPEMTAEPLLDIREGRHPVLDRLQPTGEFVPNDVVLGVESRESRVESQASGGRQPADASECSTGADISIQQGADAPRSPSPNLQSVIRNPQLCTGRIQIITGPNMAGKSTYIRQAALITILAQMGSFVPATEARIGIADRVFARVGASDELGKGQSTFMVEMTEAARILHAATKSSLVILDEIGRGTSTYDGISLAWAITEHLHDVVVCRTLFATHYHELTELTQTLSGTSNWNVAIREQDDDVIFLHRIVEGAADKSYGIHVARLAGVPTAVIDRARVILDTLEADHLDESGRPNVPPRQSRSSREQQLSLFTPPPHPLLDEIRDMDLDQMTPLAALEELHRLRQTLKD